jgi:hypothetical protein
VAIRANRTQAAADNNAMVNVNDNDDCGVLLLLAVLFCWQWLLCFFLSCRSRLPEDTTKLQYLPPAGRLFFLAVARPCYAVRRADEVRTPGVEDRFDTVSREERYRYDSLLTI